jgi:hypothetical protein
MRSRAWDPSRQNPRHGLPPAAVRKFDLSRPLVSEARDTPLLVAVVVGSGIRGD